MNEEMLAVLLAAGERAITMSAIDRHWWRNRRKGAVPMLTFVLGSDEHGCGMSVHLRHKGVDGGKTVIEPLITVRWQVEPQTTEDLVSLALRGLQAYYDARGWPSP